MNFSDTYSIVPDEVKELSKLTLEHSTIDTSLYAKYDVKRGLRDIDGHGVLTGLTEISEVWGRQIDENGDEHEVEGILRYRGYNIDELIKGHGNKDHFCFEEITFLILFGKLPTDEEFEDFKKLLAGYRALPTNFVRDIIMKAPSRDMMNTLARSVLTLYSYDHSDDDTSIENVLRQCLELIALFPQLAVYGYQTYKYYHDGDSFFIHAPKPELSAAENILHMLRPDSQFTHVEARVLDIALVLHAEHGGGNNSTFTTHVVTSSGTDTYSAIAAALGSLKGPKHGGANIKNVHMFDDIKANVKDWTSDEEISEYLIKILNKEAFDKSGLIYGIGHAIYTKSDPRAQMLKMAVKELATEKGLLDEYELRERVARLTPGLIAERRKMYKNICPNIDFYSGFAYRMLGLPEELFTPLFACARITGWSAHRLEEIINVGKIIRPAYMNICPEQEYVDMENRD
ncbi:MAG: citrate/2-methylcitrate synthase [Oscillospiraceae bacterium]|nr:citrate/2-methylcitrate synthase [Candidatus Limimonas coprohippi]MCQ2488203.1 citrate/2-methylcitrate synthase [Clostridia bacterium]